MASALANVLSKGRMVSLEAKMCQLSISYESTRNVYIYMNQKPRLRNPVWFTEKHRKARVDQVTPDNKEFLQEVVKDRYSHMDGSQQPEIPTVDWTPKMQRTGLITRKIGIYPLWLKDGKKITTTLLQVLDNHVIKYYPPETYDPPRKPVEKVYNKKGCLLLGAEGADPSIFTREYCGLFKDSGVIPKKTLARFFVSPDGALPIGTLLDVRHFQVGNFVDVRGLTIDRGFQGVMKRHGFSGMPATHGVTKTHRRGGCIGGGGEKGRVWPGTKMPGHMGNRWRTLRGLKIWRIDRQHNVLYVSGQNVPGGTNSIVYVYDTKLWRRRASEALPFPTYVGDKEEEEEEERVWLDEKVHAFDAPSILYKE